MKLRETPSQGEQTAEVVSEEGKGRVGVSFWTETKGNAVTEYLAKRDTNVFVEAINSHFRHSASHETPSLLEGAATTAEEEESRNFEGVDMRLTPKWVRGAASKNFLGASFGR